MADYSSNHRTNPVIKGVSYSLAHVPGMLRHGSKPSRELSRDPSLLKTFLGHLQTFEEAVSYPPNQVFIGNLDPEDLTKIKTPWYRNPVAQASRWGAFGEIMPEDEFYGMLKICDEFDLIWLDTDLVQQIASKLREHPLARPEDMQRLGEGVSLEQIENKLNEEQAMPLYVGGSRLVGCCQRPRGEGAGEDPNLIPHILIENLAARASGVLALRRLIANTGEAENIDYLLGCGEEAVGDRYNRGGGNLAKAIGEPCGCVAASGSDVKAFCCAPVHALVLAAGLVNSGIFENVAVVAGGSFSKLGMKFQGHLRHDMPILEDVLAGVAIWVSRDDGKSPVIRLDSIGKHEISSGSSQQSILEKLVVQPLDRMGLGLTQIDKYATEMQNPELTEPQGSGNVPQINYRTIGSYAVIRNEIQRDELDHFVQIHGMPGFSPTQGHIASAVPVMGHSVRKMINGEMERTMFLAKGSLFLGRVTQLSDGMSFLLEKNRGAK
ncbi:MAG: glycine reductase [Deltaproteobacteria bacterium]|nr:glycine reductase [Deltaproteobacteria bacterium]MBW1944931.1 glycine reductase [Deltaproteobacteria bacterium]